MVKRVRPAKHYQRADNPARLLMIKHKRTIARDLRGALGHLRELIDAQQFERKLRSGQWRGLQRDLNWTHFREIAKPAFARIGAAYEDGAQLGVRKINGVFGQARRRVRFRKARLDILFDKAVGDRFNFDLYTADVQNALREAQDALIQQLEQDARDTIEQSVIYGAQNGLSAADIVDNIRDVIGLTDTQAQAVTNFRLMLEDLDPAALTRQLRNTTFDEAIQDAIDSGEFLSSSVIDEMVQDYADNYLDYRASMIAQTESSRAVNEGLHDAYSQAIERGALPDDAVNREWELGDSPCPICESIPDNNPDGVGVDESFDSDDGPVDDPPLHPNCWPAGSLVSSGSGISAVSSRWYDGKLAIIRTASGKEISGTINHPILTQRGWVALGFLNHGDHVIRRTETERLFGGMDYQNVPTLFENVASAASQSGEMSSRKVPLTAKDFHGDASDCQIAIVWANRKLMTRRKSTILQHVGKFFFKIADAQLSFKSRLCPLFFFHHAMATPASGDVCLRSLPFALFRGHLFIPQYHRLPITASRLVHFSQNAVDNRAADAKLARELLLGRSGSVEFDQVIDVRNVDFRGHVYNLQTGESHYTVDGIISHNCMCSVNYVTDISKVPDDTQDFTEYGIPEEGIAP